MSSAIAEGDWKVLREIHRVALDRFCERVLGEIAAVAVDAGRGNHERYLAVRGIIKRRDLELADAFDDLRRSNALMKLACIQSHGLVTDDEFDRFSAETRDKVRALVDTARS